ncbi:hypothetical protein [Halorientalis pallida]|uniref:hypothetical protein n=1 Tax=Halorientalis pallida TaxID=2479928 RepID=UPI00187D4CD7|nr:hypothetical protein [Halorientalis pallida]
MIELSSSALEWLAVGSLLTLAGASIKFPGWTVLLAGYDETAPIPESVVQNLTGNTVLRVGIDTPRHQPYSNLPSVLMNSVTAGDVETVVVDGAVLIEARSVEPMDAESVRAATTRERDRPQARTGWETSLAGSTPADRSMRRRVSGRALLRATKQYGRGVVNRHR